MDSPVKIENEAEKFPSRVQPSVKDAEAVTHTITYDDTHRMLKSRHIQLIGIGGTIGTALFVGILTT